MKPITRRYFIITGESSGDKLGALLAVELLALGHSVSGWGGQLMRDAGVHLYQDIQSIKVMGWTDVIRHIPKFYRLIETCKRQITSDQIDHLILIDYGSFNLRIAQWAFKHDIKVTYYSPPKVWASRPRRIRHLVSYCDQIIVLFPFEQTYFLDKGVSVEYFGHPLMSTIIDFVPDINFLKQYHITHNKMITVLPGSRRSEVSRTLPIYLECIKQLEDDYVVCIACANDMKAIIEKIITQHPSLDVKVIQHNYYDLLSHSQMAICTSGTASIELAMFGVPQIVGYKTSMLNYIIAKQLIRTKHISLVNLMANDGIVIELIQHQLNVDNLNRHIKNLGHPAVQSSLKNKYSTINSQLYDEDCMKKTIAAIIGTTS